MPKRKSNAKKSEKIKINTIKNSKNISKDEFSKILDKLNKEISKMRKDGTKGALLSQNVRDNTNSTPFHILIGCIISLRTKDATTEQVSKKLFAKANTINEMANLSIEKLEKLIYPAGFYRNKAQQIKDICISLLTEYNSVVPDTIEELVKFKGVGRKTANLVVTLGFNKPGICVDTHVQRITHRIGFIEPKKFDEEGKSIFHTADQTELILRDKLDKRWWIDINDVLVTWGQTICAPVSPKCSQCVISSSCNKVGVIKSR